MLFDHFTLKNVTFENRLLRSSIGGRTAYYDGTVSNAWKNFDLRFAKHGVGGIISATIDIDEDRVSPLEYPKISHDRFIKPFSEAINEIKQTGCKYIMQLGDPGFHTQMSLFPQDADCKSASSGTFDQVFGYGDESIAMTEEEIQIEIFNFAEAARRVVDIGCDGLEITASKGYLIHQFLNPWTNRRNDQYGGDAERRFRFLKEIVEAVRKKIGKDFLFGIRLSAEDKNYLPVRLRRPQIPFSEFRHGNRLEQMLDYGRRLKDLGIDYLHISSGFGFINPFESPGKYPLEAIRIFTNATRHLSSKAEKRALELEAMPDEVANRILGYGWKFRPAINLDYAERFRAEVGLPVIANGGFQKLSTIENALQGEKCDLIAMARPLLANPNLVEIFRNGQEEPENPCTYCNLCSVRTAVHPLGCYDITRFSSQDEMEKQILEWSATIDS